MSSTIHDVVDMADELKSNAVNLHLGPERWTGFSPGPTLNWESQPWMESNRKRIPNERGIYVFSLVFGNDHLPEHGYVLYVGIAGDRRSQGTLRSRFLQYFHEQKKKRGRSKVGYMLAKWGDHLTFQFARVPDRRFSLSKLERQLCDAIVPYASVNDLSVTVRRGKRAAGL